MKATANSLVVQYWCAGQVRFGYNRECGNWVTVSDLEDFRAMHAQPRTILSTCILVSSFVAGIQGYATATELWEQVALSDLIVIGKGVLQECKVVEKTEHSPGYAKFSIDVHVSSCLKGGQERDNAGQLATVSNVANDTKDLPALPIYKVIGAYGIDSWKSTEDQLKKSEEAAFFLVVHPEDAAYRLLGIEAVAMNGIAQEVETQAATLKHFLDDYGWRSWPHQDKVKVLVDEMSKPNKAYAACVQLEQLGPEALPAIILEMRTKEPCAAKSIQIATPPESFEGIYHKRVRGVSDALRVVASLLATRGSPIFSNYSAPPPLESWDILLSHFESMRERLLSRGYVPKIVPQDMSSEKVHEFLRLAESDWASR